MRYCSTKRIAHWFHSEAEKFWDIVPDSVLCHGAELEREKRRLREMESQEKAEMEKKRAKSNSCCGRAFKDVSGRWLPIDPIARYSLKNSLKISNRPRCPIGFVNTCNAICYAGSSSKRAYLRFLQGKPAVGFEPTTC
jgi:hypothetical protein